MAARTMARMFLSRTHKMYTGVKIRGLCSRVEDNAMDLARQQFGFVPSFYKTLSERPRELEHFAGLYDATLGADNEQGLNRREKELVALRVSSGNHCVYCILAHSLLLQDMLQDKLVPKQVAIRWQVADISERDKLILGTTEKILQNEAITQELRNELCGKGLGKEELWDIGSVVAMIAYTNTMSNVMGLKPDKELLQ